MRAAAFAAAACLVVPAIVAGAEAPAVVSLVEGPAALLRAAGRFALAEGVHVHGGDIVEVPDKGLVQIEFADGTRLSLGPQSRFHVAALPAPGSGAAGRGAKGATVSDFYLLQGWSKFALASSGAPLRVTTPLFGFGTAEAVAVLQVQGGAASVFVERGTLRLSEGFFAKATPTSPISVSAGQFYARKADEKGVLQARPAPSFISGMPGHYRDNLPERLARFKDREVSPRRLGELAYADVEPWLKGPPELRRPVMQRLRARARDPEFRKALITNLSFHPEWDRILFPEKYQPKPPPVPDPSPAPGVAK
jgi:hypothetical protein